MAKLKRFIRLFAGICLVITVVTGNIVASICLLVSSSVSLGIMIAEMERGK